MEIVITFKKVLLVAVTCVVSWIFTFLATDWLMWYAYGLFIWLPVFIGAVSTLLYCHYFPLAKKVYKVAFITLTVYCFGLIAFAFEGIICIIMAAPIGIFFTWVGYRIGLYIVRKRNAHRNIPVSVVLFLISVPAFMAFEKAVDNHGNICSVTTAIEINASEEMVWKNVISFPQLKTPVEFVFKTGIAYPVNATIDGHGVGAVRRCNFTTGSFIEPITVWDEPHLLRFSVSVQPKPMKELSPYPIHPNHLHGFWVSKEGQFKITALTNGHTLLEGTTWYENKIKPGIYWTMWSDYIVHQIHKRVLKHIKEQAEMLEH